MKSSYKFMQGASKSTGKSLDLQGFFACHFVFCTKFCTKKFYIHKISESHPKTRYLSHTRFRRKNHRKGGSFLSIVKYSACELVHEINVFQDFYFIHVIHIFKAS